MLFSFFFFNDTATTEIYTLSLHDALPISILTPAICTGPPSTGRSVTLETICGCWSSRVIDWPTAAPKSPVIQAVEGSPSNAKAGLSLGTGPKIEPELVAVTERAPLNTAVDWRRGSPNRLSVVVPGLRGSSARRVGE